VIFGGPDVTSSWFLSWLLKIVILCSPGPAFIKWGQWASTRPDIFPADVCDELSRLHMQVCEFLLEIQNYIAINNLSRENLLNFCSRYLVCCNNLYVGLAGA